MPPELMAAMQQLASEQQPMMEEPPAPSQSGPDILKQIIGLIGAYQEVEQDDQDLLVAEQARTLFQKLLADQAKEQDDLIQGKATPRSLRRNA
jgi:hypothetical protein